MAEPDYYVRGINDTEARGPFTVEQLASLAEAGQVTPETYYYNTETEQWVTLDSNEQLKAGIWPQKKKLAFRKSEPTSSTSETKPVDTAPPITVQQFLDAAEGRTEETKGRQDRSLDIMRAAIWGSRGVALILLVSAVSLALPSLDAVLAMDTAKLFARPIVFLGVVDFVLSVLLLLGIISLYPFVRFRAVFGIGFLGFLLWTQGNVTSVAVLLAGSAGLYFSTIFLNYVPLGAALLAGLAGMGALAGMSLF